MLFNPLCRNGTVYLVGWKACVGAALLVGALLASPAAAQPPPAQPPGFPTRPESPPTLQMAPINNPRSLAEIATFVDKLSTNDAVFEVILGQSRIMTLKDEMKVPSVVAVGDPSIAEFTVLNPRQIRILGQRIGVTDITVVISDDRIHSFEVRVVADLDPLRLRLYEAFPDASLKLAQLRDHVVVEGQARDTVQVARILETVRAYLKSIHAQQLVKIRQRAQLGSPGISRPGATSLIPLPGTETPAPAGATAEQVLRPDIEATIAEPTVINLIRVPSSQQVLLKVRVAEMNRTAMRQIGADFIAVDNDGRSIVGSQIGGATIKSSGIIGPGGLRINEDGNRTLFDTSTLTTVFGIFEKGGFEFLLQALRQNALLKILAEPNLVTMNGHEASFLAGGEFPVPIAQASTGGAGTSVTVQFQQFGVILKFIPYVLDDDTLRLSIDPEVSSIDFALGTVLVPGGTPVPGLDVRKAHTTVELHQGQTLAIAGLLQLQLQGQTHRIPGLGDLPILGPFFSNTTDQRQEKELVVLVTPYLVEPMNHGQVPPSPGDEVNEPNDLEFYFLNRIQGRTGRDFRATTEYDDAAHLLRCFFKMEKDHVCGPYGHSEQ